MIFEDHGFPAASRLTVERADPAQAGREVDVNLNVSHGRPLSPA